MDIISRRRYMMWWKNRIFGGNAYQVLLWFVLYSILGWLVESVYMSICNRKITNRGFARGPMCPIYGFGALTVFFILRPYSENPFRLFVMGMFLATTLEFVTARIMQRFFGEIWWDYQEKPFNYQGIICLESSIAWGFYTVALFLFLHKRIVSMVDCVPARAGKILGSVIMGAYLIDFMLTVYKEKKSDLEDVLEESDERERRFL